MQASTQQHIEEGIARGKRNAASMVERDKSDFHDDHSVYSRTNIRKSTEPFWFRKEMTNTLRGKKGGDSLSIASSETGRQEYGIPYGSFQRTIHLNLLRTRTIHGVTLRKRPSLYDHVVEGCCVTVIDFNAEPYSTTLNMSLGSVPCSCPECEPDEHGKWNTVPVNESWKKIVGSGSSSILIDANGRTTPLEDGKSLCLRCEFTNVCVCVCVYVYIYTYECMCVIYIYIYIYIYDCMCVRMYECLCVCMKVCVYVCISVRMSVYVYICICICICICLCIICNSVLIAFSVANSITQKQCVWFSF